MDFMKEQFLQTPSKDDSSMRSVTSSQEQEDSEEEGANAFTVLAGTSWDELKHVRQAVGFLVCPLGSLSWCNSDEYLPEIVVACSAGNSGPTPSTVTNVAPWIITVAASSIDRVFPSPLVLGNQMKIQTVSTWYLSCKQLEGNNIVLNCLPGTLSPKLVKGKIVVCLGFNVQSAMEVKRVGGVGIVLVNIYGSDSGMPLGAQLLTGTTVGLNDIATIVNYTRTNVNPTATLIPGTTILGSKPAPFMAPFTSLGPNGLEPNIIKWQTLVNVMNSYGRIFILYRLLTGAILAHELMRGWLHLKVFRCSSTKEAQHNVKHSDNVEYGLLK
ncbi:hypothetical protein TEA_016630 [Camellia sinensis var. sinensis]|uniref:PA domain-containing protein n=1 Tax=Camellia sinensis var. sinensis TaxID=542762 RepID=A0A4S4DUE4_CAMSN|nr:hypothetical protein TEA_016630 [Camellia sinensis var. sinensis]